MFANCSKNIATFDDLLYFNALFYIQICGNPYAQDGNARTLTANDFKQLKIIEDLALNYLNIEFIEYGAFDFIGETLQTLNLQSNRIKFIIILQFAGYFDEFTGRNIDWRRYKELYLEKNPLVCDCNFYEVHNFSYIAGRRYKKMGHHISPAHLKCIDGHFDGVCPDVQTISSERLFLRQPTFEVVAMPRAFICIALRMCYSCKQSSSQNFDY